MTKGGPPKLLAQIINDFPNLNVNLGLYVNGTQRDSIFSQMINDHAFDHELETIVNGNLTVDYSLNLIGENEDGANVLWLMASKQHWDLVPLALKKCGPKVDLNVVPKMRGATSMFEMAVTAKKWNVANLLLERGVAIETPPITYSFRSTHPLYIAASRGEWELVGKILPLLQPYDVTADQQFDNTFFNIMIQNSKWPLLAMPLPPKPIWDSRVTMTNSSAYFGREPSISDKARLLVYAYLNPQGIFKKDDKSLREIYLQSENKQLFEIFYDAFISYNSAQNKDDDTFLTSLYNGIISNDSSLSVLPQTLIIGVVKAFDVAVAKQKIFAAAQSLLDALLEKRAQVSKNPDAETFRHCFKTKCVDDEKCNEAIRAAFIHEFSQRDRVALFNDKRKNALATQLASIAVCDFGKEDVTRIFGEMFR